MLTNIPNKMQKEKKNNGKIERANDDHESTNSHNDNDYGTMIDSRTSNQSSASNSAENAYEIQKKNTPQKYIPKNPKRRLAQPSECNIKKSRPDHQSAFKPPTVEELNQLRETENLHHSNLFRLQIEELLNEIRIKEKHKTFIEKWLNEFNVFLGKLKSQPEKNLANKLAWLNNTNVRLPLVLKDMHSKKFQFQFIKPEEPAFLIGSTANDTSTGNGMIVDICILMPSGFFQKENYLNLIYDQKRALYLTYIVDQMLKDPVYAENQLSFRFFKNNPHKPILEIYPDWKATIFRIFISPEEGAFKLSRFVPWNSNIRGTLFGQEEEKNGLPVATPNYNFTVLCDLTMKFTQKKCADYLANQKNLREALMLLKIWLRLRRLDAGFSGFTSHILTMFVVYLFKERKLHSSMSSYQVVRHVWNELAVSQWNVEGKAITLYEGNNARQQPTWEQFHTYYELVFVDFTGYMNITSNLSTAVYAKVKQESLRAVNLLDNKEINSFHQLFIVKIPIYTQFDHVLKITDQFVIEKTLMEYGKKSDWYNFAGYWYPQFLKMIASVLCKGLSKRILAMIPIEGDTDPWTIASEPYLPRKSLKLGILLDPDNAFNILDKGPQANDPTAEAYRKFWGNKSQLRRFQDGSITEACVWCPAEAILSQKRLIARSIVLHLLEQHFKIQSNRVTYFADEFDNAYKMEDIRLPFERGIVVNDAENTALQVIKVFDELGKNLRTLDLPLHVHSVQGISPVFRYSEPRPILPQATSCTDNDKQTFQANQINNGILQLGLSGKWPNELSAFRRIKTAFHIKIAKSLRVQFHLKTRAGIDGVTILKDGYVFKLEIAHPKELSLLRKDGVESEAMIKRTEILPKVTSALHALYQRYPSYAGSVMIAKRWLYSQLIDPFLWPDECTELLIAYQFLTMSAVTNPSQPQIGFFRILHLLANANWKSELFIVNFNDELTRKEISSIERKFNVHRDAFASLALVTSFDMKKYGIWSRNAPLIPILLRVSRLAAAALQSIEKTFLINESKFRVADLFTASLEGYDVLIQVKHKLVSPTHTKIFINDAAYQANVKIPPAGFDPVESCIQQLREGYSDFGVFFYDPCGGRVIAVKWRPDVWKEREFKAANINGCKLTPDGKLVCNLEQCINDIKIICRDLAYNIDVITPISGHKIET